MAKSKDQTSEAKSNEASQASEQQVAVPDSEVFYGTILWFNSRSKGFGFILMDGYTEGDNDIFCNIKHFLPDKDTGKKPEPQAGDRVSFILIDPPNNNKKKNPIASDINILQKAGEKE